MKKNKKITNVHDYTKEVDKIIATGKPMVEQFMDLMGLMDVTFIDENQTNNGRLHQLTKSDRSIKRPKKQDSSVQDKQTSDCCGAKVLTVQGYPKDEGTHYWQCSKCGAPCNIMNPCGSQTKRKRDATTGSTATVHLNVFGIGGKIDRFFLSGKDITLYSAKRFIRKLFLDILKHNKDPMTGLYDYDGIAQEVIDLTNEGVSATHELKMKQSTKPVKRILNKTPSTGNKPNNEWEKEYDGQFGGLTGEVIDKYDLDAIKLFISKTLQQQREEYEYTRKEIIDWLHEQNWKCEKLEKLLIQPKK